MRWKKKPAKWRSGGVLVRMVSFIRSNLSSASSCQTIALLYDKAPVSFILIRSIWISVRAWCGSDGDDWAVLEVPGDPALWLYPAISSGTVGWMSGRWSGLRTGWMAELRGLSSAALSLVGGWWQVVSPRGQYWAQCCLTSSSTTWMKS